MKVKLQAFNPKMIVFSIFQDFGMLIIGLQAIALRIKNGVPY